MAAGNCFETMYSCRLAYTGGVSRIFAAEGLGLFPALRVGVPEHPSGLVRDIVDGFRAGYEMLYVFLVAAVALVRRVDAEPEQFRLDGTAAGTYVPIYLENSWHM